MGHIREYLADAIIGFADQIILWKSLPNFSGRCSAVNPMKQATKIKTPPHFREGVFKLFVVN
jgi:hypothetical protein